MGLREYKPIKIAINALSGKVGGGLTGFQCLLPKLGEMTCSDEVTVLVSASQETIRKNIPPHFKVYIAPFSTNQSIIRLVYEQIVLPFLLFRWGTDLLYSVGNATSLLAPCKILLLVENASPYSNLNFSWSFAQRCRLKMLKVIGYFSMKRANKVRFVSENSYKTLSDRFKFLQDKSIIITHGFSRIATEQQIYQNDDPFILTVSSVAPYKNIERIISAFGHLVNQYHYSGKLLIVGAWTYQKYKDQLEIHSVPDELRSRVNFVGEIKFEELPLFYRAADAFVFVSLIETFGLPVLEAMGYEVPVIVGSSVVNSPLDFNPYNEICAEGAAYCNPLDPQDIARVIHLVISDEKKRETMIGVGRKRAELYRWESVAHQLHDCFHAIASEMPEG